MKENDSNIIKYKVLIEYPDSPFNKGDILIQRKDGSIGYSEENTDSVLNPNQFPEIFEQL